MGATEAGQRDVNIEELAGLAEVFGVTISPMMAGVSGQVSKVPIEAGGIRLSIGDWHDALGNPLTNDALRDLIDRATKAREVALNTRRLVGPTSVASEDIGIGTAFPPWGQSLDLRLAGGAPYAARDELEANALRAAEEPGSVRRISRQEAHRLRKERTVDGTHS